MTADDPTPDLGPLGHPVHDPSPHVAARARTRVHALARRRRTRRRVLTALPVAALLVVASVAVAVTWSDADDDGQDVVAGPVEDGDGDVLSIEPNLQWDSPTLSRDRRTLTFLVGTQQAGTGPCQQTIVHDVVERDDAVTIGFRDVSGPSDGTTPCPRSLSPQKVEVQLDDPLGDRPIYDGIRSEPRNVRRLAELVDVTVVPEGFVADVPMNLNEAADGSWQLMYLADGADWYFSVIQRPTASTPPPDGTVTPIEVNGEPADRITGQMSGTMETIRFELGDLTIEVWGEMQGPPTFTHRAELLAIAEGIRPPVEGSTPSPPPEQPGVIDGVTCLDGFAEPDPALADRFEYLTEAVATEEAAALGVDFRIAGTDGECEALESDLRPTRINAVVEDGHVSAIGMG